MTQPPRESLRSKVLAPLLVVVLGAVLVGGSAPWWWKEIFHDPTPAPPGQTFGPTSFPTAPGESVTPTAAPPTAPIAGCVLKITNPFATISEEPSHSSAEIGDVPPGDYPSSTSEVVNWGGRDERWFQITASGRTGWIVYNTILVDSKSADCP